MAAAYLPASRPLHTNIANWGVNCGVDNVNKGLNRGTDCGANNRRESCSNGSSLNNVAHNVGNNNAVTNSTNGGAAGVTNSSGGANLCSAGNSLKTGTGIKSNGNNFYNDSNSGKSISHRDTNSNTEIYSVYTPTGTGPMSTGLRAGVVQTIGPISAGQHSTNTQSSMTTSTPQLAGNIQQILHNSAAISTLVSGLSGRDLTIHSKAIFFINWSADWFMAHQCFCG